MEHHGSGSLRAGDRAPDAELRDSDGKARRLFEIFREPRHTLLLFAGAFSNPEVEKFLQEVGESLGELIQTYRIVRGESGVATDELLDISGNAHMLYEVPHGGVIFVRPDGYIGYRSDSFDITGFHTFLNKIFVRPAEG